MHRWQVNFRLFSLKFRFDVRTIEVIKHASDCFLREDDKRNVPQNDNDYSGILHASQLTLSFIKTIKIVNMHFACLYVGTVGKIDCLQNPLYIIASSHAKLEIKFYLS